MFTDKNKYTTGIVFLISRKVLVYTGLTLEITLYIYFMRPIILIISLFFSIHHSPAKIDYVSCIIHADTSRNAILKLVDFPELFEKNDKPADLSISEIDQIETLINKKVYEINE
jgi:hypothetical protein